MDTKVKAMVDELCRKLAHSIEETDQSDFGHYHPKKEYDPFSFREGKSSDWTHGIGIIGHSNTAAIWGWDKDFGDWELPTPNEEKKCECGSSAIKWPVHSDWCPKYRRPDNGKES